MLAYYQLITHLLQLLFIYSEKKLLRLVDKRYIKGDNWHNLDVADGNWGYGYWHYSMIRILKPKNVLCTGSRYGFIPVVCAIACKRNGFGKVDFVDAGFDENGVTRQRKLAWGGLGFWRTVDFNQHFGAFLANDYIKTHLMTTKMFKKKYPNKLWQYIYIDSDHSYNGVKTDFSFFWPSLSSGGIMTFHDVLASDTPTVKYGTSIFWQELKKRFKQYIEIPGDFGLGVLQKEK